MAGHKFVSKLKLTFLKIKEKLIFWKRKEKPKRKPRTFMEKVWLEVKDWLMAFIVAAVVYFIILPMALGTSSPMVVVSSCSEKGYMNIGDILVIQGVDIKDINAPLVEIDRYRGFTPIFEKSGGFTPVLRNNEVTKIEISGNIVELNRSNDIIVYSAYPSGVQIIHRVFAKVRETSRDRFLLITKGDANPIPDQMSSTGTICVDENVGCISTPVSQRMLIGRKIIFPIPLLGHVKLFFCDIFPFCDGHSNLGTNYAYTLSC